MGNMSFANMAFAFIGALFFFCIGYFLRKYTAKRKLRKAEIRSKEIIEEAKQKAEARKRESQIEAKDLLLKMRSEFEIESKERKQDVVAMERRLMQREENIDRKVDLIDRKERDIDNKFNALGSRDRRLADKEKDMEKMIYEEKEKLQKISGMSRDEARRILLQRMEEEVNKEAATLIRKTQEEAKETADKEARKIVGLAIQKCAGEHTTETTVSVVNLPSDDMKGRIIGREGRNIRALEMATGVDVIIDDTPEAVILSGFDMMRRVIAKKTLEKLIEDGRIHPARIEEIADKVKKEMEQSIKEEGEKVLFDLGIHGVHPELVRLLGRLRYRTSYGQNMLQHSKETAWLMSTLAGELKLDATLAKRIGILHDIGKAVTHEVEGPHAKLGADLARKYNENDTIVHAIEAHHNDIEPKTLLAVLVQAADAISATRPGARRESLESYVKRLEQLEGIANSFNGVEKSYAIQAGREIRVVVYPDKVDDAQTVVLARDLKKQIEDGMDYPGQIKINVIRETRAVEYAK